MERMVSLPYPGRPHHVIGIGAAAMSEGTRSSAIPPRRFIQPPRRISREDGFDLIADAAEDGELFLLGAGGMRGIVEGEMVAVDEPGIMRTGLVGVAADGDDGFDALVEKLVGVFGGVGGQVDPDFRHDPDGKGMDVSGGLGPGAGDPVSRAEGFAKDAFGQVGAATVSGAEDEKEGRHGGRW